MKALIIDDQKRISESLKLLIAQSGHFTDIATVTNGIDACEQIRKDRYDLIILDLNLPEMGGQEVLQYIERLYQLEERNKENYPHIMLISGEMDIDKINSASQINVEQVLTKPFNVKDFNRKLYSILEGLNGEIIAA